MGKINRKTGIKKEKLQRTENNTAAKDEDAIFGGRYYCDYSPRYSGEYDIYEKAKNHARKIRKSLDEGERDKSR